MESLIHLLLSLSHSPEQRRTKAWRGLGLSSLDRLLGLNDHDQQSESRPAGLLPYASAAQSPDGVVLG